MIDGRTISSSHLMSHEDDHREIIQWLWSILLADGTRALARAGRWADARRHAEQHKGIGRRLLDGRQVGILAHCMARDYDMARGVLAGTSALTPWEEAVAACLTALCLTAAGCPAGASITTMMDTCLALEPAREHAVFQVRLGLCVLDLANGAKLAPQVAGAVVRDALEAADAYAALDAVTHQTCLSHAPPDAFRALTEVMQASGLGRGTIPGDVLDNLMESVRVSEASMGRPGAARTMP